MGREPERWLVPDGRAWMWTLVFSEADGQSRIVGPTPELTF